MRIILTLSSVLITNLLFAQCDLRARGSRDAAWSPDGDKIVYSSNETGIQQIYSMNAGGNDKEQLTKTKDPNYYPFYSPKGDRIVFMSYRDPNSMIYIMNADGSDLKLIGDPAINNADPHWSHDGSKIIFYTNRDGNDEIYIMNTDGTEPKRLTNNTDSDQTPSISPDGKKVAFVSNRDGNAEIYVMNIDGSNQRRLTNDPRLDRVPSWSPDSQKIIYYSRESSSVAGSGSKSWMGAEIYEVDLDGNRKQLTHNNHLDQGPVYSPDGRSFLVTSCQSGNREVFLVDIESGNAKQLTFTNQ